ncbi:MAG: MoxR family ATPase [Gammaproteobacteria bacterium AqS3]|nr:MoxR family ATPase [Gammaproteobacteria bacterium AqS3]
MLAEPDSIIKHLAGQGYICNKNIATAVYLADRIDKPVLVEGPPGVGKTELARALAAITERELVRLQCYEGLDEAKSIYEWKYGKQLLYTQMLKERIADAIGDVDSLDAGVEALHGFNDLFFSENFLEPRPLLRALTQPGGAVLLIDEVDKSDPEFESMLLEVLSDYQVTIPELGSVQADVKPLIILTSNSTREMSEALKRRCLHLYIPFPDVELERRIVTARVPEIAEDLLVQLVKFIHALREMDLKKSPAISETLDWARALTLLNADALTPELVRSTLNVVLKYQQDIEAVEKEVPKLMASSAVN